MEAPICIYCISISPYGAVGGRIPSGKGPGAKSRVSFDGGSTAPLPVFLSIYPCAARCSLAGRNATLPRGPVGLYRAATPIMPNGHMRSCAGRGAKAVESGLRP